MRNCRNLGFYRSWRSGQHNKRENYNAKSILFSYIFFYSFQFYSVELYIHTHLYKTPLGMKTNQRSTPVRCMAPGKWKDLRIKASSRIEESDRICAGLCAGRWLHNKGLAEAKVRYCDVDVLDRGTRLLLQSEERRGRSEIAERGGIMNLHDYKEPGSKELRKWGREFVFSTNTIRSCLWQTCLVARHVILKPR